MSVQLTEQEKEICDLLDKVVEYIQKEDPSKPKLVLRIAGGWVRDKLLGHESHDIDIAIDHMSGYDLAQHVNQYLESHNYPVCSIAKISQNPERSKHLETATTTVLGLAVDFVNLRSETYNSDSRIPQIEFGSPLEDALRRDITINALFYNIHTRKVEDFTQQGVSDLVAGIVRTPLEPFKTFTDDPLRVLRVLRFSSRFAYAIDPQTAVAMQRPEIKHDLDSKISRERIGVEIDKMASGPHPLLAIQRIVGYNLYENVFRAPPAKDWPSNSGAMADQSIAIDLTRNVLDLCESAADSTQSLKSLVSFLPSPFAVTGSHVRRTLILAAYIFPYYTATAYDRKRVVPASYVVVRDGIKLATHDAEDVVALHVSATKVSAAAQKCLDNSIDRRTLGLQIREIGARWAMCVVFSAAVDMLLNKCSLEQATHKYRTYIKRVIDEDLVEAYKYKHIIDGKSAAKLLGLKPGPAIRQVLDRVMEWQLCNPNGTVQECELYIAKTISQDYK
ncbi:CCA tRNA nucleotidyltransferase, mitochondrial [Coemansia spiralis]|uniref:CCA tRNA nucleotidyltransferase, mitochondrial n=2 Tax=Coemansia TaxID=4863 RepID=A0A9W8KWB8_9FUNG|nr:CCA tRNA nucleotidyltransferase, mitochondrial [Coemansia spiralis]